MDGHATQAYGMAVLARNRERCEESRRCIHTTGRHASRGHNQTDRQTGRQTDSRTDTQTYRHIRQTQNIRQRMYKNKNKVREIYVSK